MLKIVGHRGARGLAPENTLAAIRKGLEHGVDEIEIDVRVTSDGHVVLHHDLFLRDLAGNRLNIRHHTYKELLAHKPDLPTLEAAVSLVGRKVPMQIEVKWGEDTKPIIAELQHFLEHGWQHSDFLFGSKKQRTLEELHRAIPEIETVIIEPYLSMRAHWRAHRLGNPKTRLSMNYYGLWSGFIGAMQRRGYRLYAYSLNDPAKAAHWQKHGLAGVITDRPDRFQSGK